VAARLIPEVAPLLAAWAVAGARPRRNCFVVCPVSVLSSTHMVPPGNFCRVIFDKMQGKPTHCKAESHCVVGSWKNFSLKQRAGRSQRDCREERGNSRVQRRPDAGITELGPIIIWPILAFVSAMVLQNDGLGFRVGISIIVVCLTVNQIAFWIGVTLATRGQKDR
jgi:hypothetical protein